MVSVNALPPPLSIGPSAVFSNVDESAQYHHDIPDHDVHLAVALAVSLESSRGAHAAEEANAAGLSANAQGDTAGALRCFCRAFELAPVPRYVLSAANMRLKLGDASGAAAQYAELLHGTTPVGQIPLSVEQTALAERKLAEAEAAMAEAELRQHALIETERWLAALVAAEVRDAATCDATGGVELGRPSIERVIPAQGGMAAFDPFPPAMVGLMDADDAHLAARLAAEEKARAAAELESLAKDERLAAELAAEPLPARSFSGDSQIAAQIASADEEAQAARNAAELGPTFECPICFDALPELAGCRLQRCGCIFCPECLEGHVAARVSEGEVGTETLRCPVQGCAAPLSVGDVHTATWGRGRDELWEKYEKIADERELEALVSGGQARRCPAPTCNYIFIWSQPNDPRAFSCPKCERRYCLACDACEGGVGPAHDGMTCAELVAKIRADEEAAAQHESWRQANDQTDAQFLELMRKELKRGTTKPCPQCGQGITKNGGCHHHLCLHCRCRFCWNCGAFKPGKDQRHVCGTTCTKRSRRWWDERTVVLGGTREGSGGSSSRAPASLRDSEAEVAPAAAQAASAAAREAATAVREVAAATRAEVAHGCNIS